jgi:hypothetical protein
MKIIDKINKLALHNYFKRVNFRRHAVPMMRKAVDACEDLYENYGVYKPSVDVISEDWLDFYETQKNEVWSDLITVNLGVYPIGLHPIIPVKNRSRVLTEAQAKLELTQTISGDIIVFLYPPSSEVLSSEKKSYIVEYWSDPLDITVKKLCKLIELTLKVNAYHKAILFPNKKASRLMALVQAKDSVISNGGSRIWVWVMYIIKTVKGVAKLYGLGSPK